MGSSSLETIKARLLERGTDKQSLPPLTPNGPYSADLKKDIDALELPRQSSKAKREVLAGVLHLLNDDIDSAHNLAQGHEESMTANLTHAILHRREQDYWNSKWWLGRIKHPLLNSVHSGTAGAKKFVDDVERHERTKSGSPDLAPKQWQELEALLAYAIKEAEA